MTDRVTEASNNLLATYYEPTTPAERKDALTALAAAVIEQLMKPPALCPTCRLPVDAAARCRLHADAEEAVEHWECPACGQVAWEWDWDDAESAE